MKCRTCAHCAILSQTNGYCHARPPAPTFMRIIAVDGQDAIVPISHAIQFIPSYLGSTYPPVGPSNRGCGLHSLSLFTWWRWRFGQQTPVPAPVEQKRG